MGTGKLLGKPNKLRGNDLRWTSIPSRGSRNTPSRLMLQKPGISSGSYDPVWSKASFYFLKSKTQQTDMSKAFDSLRPPLLLSKLKAYGFQDNTIQLLNSYLSNRMYHVKLGNHVSSRRTVSRGCPQDSALGPLLWNIFQNDLSYCVKTNLSMYVDDHQIYHTGCNQSSVISIS